MSKQQPAICYTCGNDVPDTPRFGNEATCDDCARSGQATPVEMRSTYEHVNGLHDGAPRHDCAMCRS